MNGKPLREIDAHSKVLAVAFAAIVAVVFVLVFSMLSLDISSNETKGAVGMGEVAERAMARYRELPPLSVEAETTLTEEELKARAMTAAKVLMPGVVDAEAASEPDSTVVTYFLKDEGGEKSGWIIIECATAKIWGFADFSVRPSGEVNISVEEARAIVEEFLKSQGVDLTWLAPSQAELRTSVISGTPDNPTPEYEYLFTYEPRVDGIFVTCPQLQGGCYVNLSPEDGSIMICSLPRNNITSLPEPPSEIKIAKEEAIEIAGEKAQSEASSYPDMELDAVLTDDEITMKYRLDENDELVPYWTITFDFVMTLPEGSVPDDYDPRNFSMGGVSYSISAEDGSVVGMGRF